MNNENSVPVDGLETPGSSESAEKMKTLETPGLISSRWLFPVVPGAPLRLRMAALMSVTMPMPCYLWLAVGWGMRLAIASSLRVGSASHPSDLSARE